jgi:hypothetical protein
MSQFTWLDRILTRNVVLYFINGFIYICHCRDRMVVGFTNIYESVPITTNVMSSNPARQGVLNTTLCDNNCLWLATGLWFSPSTLVSSTNKIDCHDITEILLNTITLTLFVDIMDLLKMRSSLTYNFVGFFTHYLWY